MSDPKQDTFGKLEARNATTFLSLHIFLFSHKQNSCISTIVYQNNWSGIKCTFARGIKNISAQFWAETKFNFLLYQLVNNHVNNHLK